MADDTPSPEHLAVLATHIDNQRETILEAWTAAIEADPTLTTGVSLPRTQLRDHIPHLLDLLSSTLRKSSNETPPESDFADGTEHGLQRWQQGYKLAEVTREWGHLCRCLNIEIDKFATGFNRATTTYAHRVWSDLCWRGVSESAAEYHRLHQAEAAGQARDLETALAELNELERSRAEAWREAAHDLRGSVGAVTLTTALVTSAVLPDPVRAVAGDRLRRSVAALQEMLSDLMDLARLEAGHERRVVSQFNASTLLLGLGESALPLAAEKGLNLTTVGPPDLLVEGDSVKVRRIAQNLLLNALKYTSTGGVEIAWHWNGVNDRGRWTFSIRDTGPGYHAGPGTPLAGALEEATAIARAEELEATPNAGFVPPVASEDPRPVHPAPGEGVGLSIVKRLCELLEATLELESRAGVGSTFRVHLPTRYQHPAEPQSGNGIL